jgi:hypothetical protein
LVTKLESVISQTVTKNLKAKIQNKMRESLKFMNTRIAANMTTKNKAELVRGKEAAQ